MPDAVEADISRARNALGHRAIIGAGALPSFAPASTSVGTPMRAAPREDRSPSAPASWPDSSPPGTRPMQSRASASPPDRDRRRQLGDQSRREVGHRLAASRGPSRAAMKSRCQSPSGRPNAGLVCASTTAPADRRDRRRAAARSCRRSNGRRAPGARRRVRSGTATARSAASRWRPRRGLRAAIARHVPGDRAPIRPEISQLVRERPRIAADAVQEHERRRVGAPSFGKREPPVSGRSKRNLGHAAPSPRKPPPHSMTTSARGDGVPGRST